MHGYFDAIVEGTPAAGLMISLSNDGEHKSDTNLTFISYDSACMNCHVSSGCYVKVSVLHQLISGFLFVCLFVCLFLSPWGNWHIKSFLIIATDTLPLYPFQADLGFMCLVIRPLNCKANTNNIVLIIPCAHNIEQRLRDQSLLLRSKRGQSQRLVPSMSSGCQQVYMDETPR